MSPTEVAESLQNPTGILDRILIVATEKNRLHFLLSFILYF